MHKPEILKYEMPDSAWVQRGVHAADVIATLHMH